jgi:hypothetical protein
VAGHGNHVTAACLNSVDNFSVLAARRYFSTWKKFVLLNTGSIWKGAGEYAPGLLSKRLYATKRGSSPGKLIESVKVYYIPSKEALRLK